MTIEIIIKNQPSEHGGTYSLEKLKYFDGTVRYIVHYSEQGNDLYSITSLTSNHTDIENAIKKYLEYLKKDSASMSRI